MMEYVFFFIQVFLGRPWLAFTTAGVFLVLGCALLRREKFQSSFFVSTTGAVWILYGVYESMVVTLSNVSPGSGNFRLDTVIIYPLLGMMTLISLWFACSGLRATLQPSS
jgi:hypothetical protein